MTSNGFYRSGLNPIGLKVQKAGLKVITKSTIFEISDDFLRGFCGHLLIWGVPSGNSETSLGSPTFFSYFFLCE